MIPQRELAGYGRSGSWTKAVIEKDYVLGWLLAGIAHHPELRPHWIFKGGTCLRKCYYETFRFSEDLDFTVVEGSPEDPADLMRIFADVASWVREESGIELVLDDASFKRKQNKRGKPTTQGRIAYRGPNGNPTMPKVKLDLTSDEVLVDRAVWRRIGHPYSDRIPDDGGVLCYSIVELFGEKLRALAERCRPRDLYDVVHMHRHPDLIGTRFRCGGSWNASASTPGLRPHRRRYPVVTVPGGNRERVGEHARPSATTTARPLREVLGNARRRLCLGLWNSPNADIAASPTGSSHHLGAPKAITSWRRRVPLELLRYAGANRLKVEVDYRAEQGRQGPRVVSRTRCATHKKAILSCSSSTTEGSCVAIGSTTWRVSARRRCRSRHGSGSSFERASETQLRTQQICRIPSPGVPVLLRRRTAMPPGQGERDEVGPRGHRRDVPELTTDQKVGGSNPSEREKCWSQACRRAFDFRWNEIWHRLARQNQCPQPRQTMAGTIRWSPGHRYVTPITGRVVGLGRNRTRRCSGRSVGRSYSCVTRSRRSRIVRRARTSQHKMATPDRIAGIG